MFEGKALKRNRGTTEPINTKPLIGYAVVGPVGNVSNTVAPTLERADRIQPAVSVSSLGNMENSRLVDVKPWIPDVIDMTKRWKIFDIADPSQMKALRLPDSKTAGKVVRLMYTNDGLALLALASNAVHKLWKWPRNDRNNPSGKASAYVLPQVWQPRNGILMANDVNDNKPAEESTACIALSKNDSYIMSASGGKISFFNMMTFKVETKLKGHRNQITGLAFSQTLNILVSSGADAQLCVWSIFGWEKKKTRLIQAPTGRQSPLVGETKIIQFHNDHTQLLVAHESQIAVYDNKLDCLRSWTPKDALAAPISCAIYSCDGLLVYATFCDGAVGVFDANSLRLRCRMVPSAYIPSFPLSGGNPSYPLVVAAHPSEPNQIAVGMTDGSVHVVEPSDAELKWGGTPSQDNGPSNSSNPSPSGQASELPSR